MSSKRQANPEQVRELYLSGWQFKEIIERLHIGRMTIWRYMKETGGLTLEDRATHLMNRRKLVERGEV